MTGKTVVQHLRPEKPCNPATHDACGCSCTMLGRCLSCVCYMLGPGMAAAELCASMCCIMQTSLPSLCVLCFRDPRRVC